MNRKIFLAVTSLILVSLVVSACGSSQAAIEKAIAQTETAKPTATPTSTHTPTPIPTKTSTPKPTATSTITPTNTNTHASDFTDEKMEFFAGEVYNYFNSGELDCPIAEWTGMEEFSVACMIPGSDFDKDLLLKAAYVVTAWLAQKIIDLNYSIYVTPAFQFVITMKSVENKVSVTAKTNNEMIRTPLLFMEYNYELWESLAEIDIEMN